MLDLSKITLAGKFTEGVDAIRKCGGTLNRIEGKRPCDDDDPHDCDSRVVIGKNMFYFFGGFGGDVVMRVHFGMAGEFGETSPAQAMGLVDPDCHPRSGIHWQAS